MLESTLEKAGGKYAARRGCIVHKLYNPSDSGWPDRLYMPKPPNKPFYIEYKRRGERPRPLQLYRQKQLRAQGYAAYVCDNLEDAKRIIDEHTLDS